MHLEQTLDPQASYVVNTPGTFDGVKLGSGDFLPESNSVRSNPGRLELLCRQRILSPVVTQSKNEAAPLVAAKDDTVLATKMEKPRNKKKG